MKQEYEIKTVLEDVLNRHETSPVFEKVWRNHQQSVSRRMDYLPTLSLIILLIVISLFTGGVVSYGVFRNIDKIDYPFVNDPRIIGRWETVDFVADIDDFNPKAPQFGDLYLNSLAFIKNGEMLVSANRGHLRYSSLSWTKDRILNKQDMTDSNYLIKSVSGMTYLFFEWKSGDYIFRNAKPKFYVLKKVDTEDYSDYQVPPLHVDKVDYPFIDDPAMRGEWKSFDFVSSIEDFVPGRRNWPGDLYLTRLKLDENGKLTVATASGTNSSPSVVWTKGMIIHKMNRTTSQCEIKTIDGSMYMFFEWKSGDYVYRGEKPHYYVLVKS